MIDLGRLAIPFNEKFCFGNPADGIGEVDLIECQKRGAKLQAGLVEYDSLGNPQITDLSSPYESLPSSNATMSFKIFKGGDNYWPFVEIKASPAKLLQGHNVYGSDNFELCLLTLVQVFQESMPELASMVDIHLTEIKQLDCTYTAHLKNQSQCKQVINALSNIQSNQTRASKNTHETTCYWGINGKGENSSRHKRLKAYLKEFELLALIKEYTTNKKYQNLPVYKKQIEAMQSPEVMSFAKNALRFEASVLPRFLKRNSIPTLLGDFLDFADEFKGSLCQHLWTLSFKDIFDALGGRDMTLFDDEEIKLELQNRFVTETKNGNLSFAKSDRLFFFYRAIQTQGFKEVKSNMSKTTFYRNMADLTLVVSKAHLQNLHGITSNVIPLLKVINIDFANQHPDSWVEPQALKTNSHLTLVA